jgi:hypothetical protein
MAKAKIETACRLGTPWAAAVEMALTVNGRELILRQIESVRQSLQIVDNVTFVAAGFDVSKPVSSPAESDEASKRMKIAATASGGTMMIRSTMKATTAVPTALRIIPDWPADRRRAAAVRHRYRRRPSTIRPGTRGGIGNARRKDFHSA